MLVASSKARPSAGGVPCIGAIALLSTNEVDALKFVWSSEETALRDVEESQPVGDTSGLGAGLGVELGQDPGDVDTGGLGADV